MSGRTLLDRILAPGGMRCVIQPIFALDDGAPPARVAVEALTRGPAGTNVESADVLFEYVVRKRALGAVDRACIRVALEAVARGGVTCDVFLNVHAYTLEAGDAFATFLADEARAAGVDPGRLVMEVVERVTVHDSRVVGRTLDAMQEMGVRVALDDFGIGYSNLHRLMDFRPEYLKVDAHFVHGAAEQTRAARMLAGVVRMADELGVRCIAEGIETEAHLAAVRDVGIGLAQGYLLGRPEAAPPAHDAAALPRDIGPASRLPAAVLTARSA
jgi:EAL domain-containing protein (putative c-di-GMP-specific phosphodiesterase class I)